ncbi:response regulator [Salinispirillum marinum]|uniref:Response regulator n=2 Tax=Saccharospirillaceae TaxID=255527 RepID=A0ABV8BGU0_9GAMM
MTESVTPPAIPHHILIVEDHPEVCQTLRADSRIAFPGCHILTAETLQKAQTLCAHSTFDLILLDIGLPDGEGTEVLRKPGVPEQTTVVVTTLFDDDEHLFEALRLGALGYLLKDDTGTDMVEALQGILAGRPPLSPSIAKRILQSFAPKPTQHMLSPREEEVLILISRGYSAREAAQALAVSAHTVADYVKSVYRKLHINNRAEATAEAMRRGLLR